MKSEARPSVESEEREGNFRSIEKRNSHLGVERSEQSKEIW